MGHTLQLDVPEDVYEPLVKAAEQTGQSPEALATEWLVAATRNLVTDSLEPFIGAFSSDAADWVHEHDKYIGKAIMDTMSPRETQTQL